MEALKGSPSHHARAFRQARPAGHKISIQVSPETFAQESFQKSLNDLARTADVAVSVASAAPTAGPAGSCPAAAAMTFPGVATPVYLPVAMVTPALVLPPQGGTSATPTLALLGLVPWAPGQPATLPAAAPAPMPPPAAGAPASVANPYASAPAPAAQPAPSAAPAPAPGTVEPEHSHVSRWKKAGCGLMMALSLASGVAGGFVGAHLEHGPTPPAASQSCTVTPTAKQAEAAKPAEHKAATRPAEHKAASHAKQHKIVHHGAVAHRPHRMHHPLRHLPVPPPPPPKPTPPPEAAPASPVGIGVVTTAPAAATPTAATPAAPAAATPTVATPAAPAAATPTAATPAAPAGATPTAATPAAPAAATPTTATPAAPATAATPAAVSEAHHPAIEIGKTPITNAVNDYVRVNHLGARYMLPGEDPAPTGSQEVQAGLQGAALATGAGAAIETVTALNAASQATALAGTAQALGAQAQAAAMAGNLPKAMALGSQAKATGAQAANLGSKAKAAAAVAKPLSIVSGGIAVVDGGIDIHNGVDEGDTIGELQHVAQYRMDQLNQAGEATPQVKKDFANVKNELQQLSDQADNKTARGGAKTVFGAMMIASPFAGPAAPVLGGIGAVGYLGTSIIEWLSPDHAATPPAPEAAQTPSQPTQSQAGPYDNMNDNLAGGG